MVVFSLDNSLVEWTVTYHVERTSFILNSDPGGLSRFVCCMLAEPSEFYSCEIDKQPRGFLPADTFSTSISILYDIPRVCRSKRLINRRVYVHSSILLR